MREAARDVGQYPSLAANRRDHGVMACQHAAAQQQITLLCEALNPRDAPGYFLHDQRVTDRLVSRIDRPNARVQLDLYHAQITHGDLSLLIRSLAGRIGHVQIASVPDRHEPVSGEINYAHISGNWKRRDTVTG